MPEAGDVAALRGDAEVAVDLGAVLDRHDEVKPRFIGQRAIIATAAALEGDATVHLKNENGIQRRTKWYVNLAKQDPGKARQNS